MCKQKRSGVSEDGEWKHEDACYYHQGVTTAKEKNRIIVIMVYIEDYAFL